MSGRQGFKYDGKSCVDYNVWIGYVETSLQDSNNIQTSYSYDFSMSPATHRARITNIRYSEPYSFNMEIISEETVDAAQERNILKWLIDSPQFKKLEFFNLNDSESFFDGLHYNCILSNPKRLFGNGGIVGWEVTVLADGAYAWTEPQTYQYFMSENFNFVHTNNSDEPYYTHPNVTIVVTSGVGECQIYNQTTGDEFIVSSANNETITVDEFGQLKSSSNSNVYERCSGKIRLAQGENVFAISGHISSISFNYQDARKVGYFA